MRPRCRKPIQRGCCGARRRGKRGREDSISSRTSKRRSGDASPCCGRVAPTRRRNSARPLGGGAAAVFPRLAIAAGEALAGSLLVTGELAEAERVVDETVELAARAGDVPRARHRVARVACNLALEHGDAWAALHRRETAAEPSDDQRIAFHGDVARWNARLKGAPAVRMIEEHSAAGRADASKVGCPRCEAELLLLSAEAFALIGDRAQAHSLLAAWDGRGGHTGESALLKRAHVGAVAQAEVADRVEALRMVADRAEASPFRLEGLWVRLDLGWRSRKRAAPRRLPSSSVWPRWRTSWAPSPPRHWRGGRSVRSASARGAARRCRRAHGARTRDRTTRGRGRLQPRDRAAAVSLPEDGRAARLESAAEGRGSESRRARRAGGGARSRGSSPMTGRHERPKFATDFSFNSERSGTWRRWCCCSSRLTVTSTSATARSPSLRTSA